MKSIQTYEKFINDFLKLGKMHSEDIKDDIDFAFSDNTEVELSEIYVSNHGNKLYSVSLIEKFYDNKDVFNGITCDIEKVTEINLRLLQSVAKLYNAEISDIHISDVYEYTVKFHFYIQCTKD